MGVITCSRCLMILCAVRMDIGNICNIQLVNVAKRNLAITAKAESVVPLPGGQLGGVVVAAAFSKTTVLFSNTGKTASFPALVHRFGDPVDPRVAANLCQNPINICGTWEPPKTYSLVIGVDKYDLVVFVDTILVNPVRVQDSQITTAPPNALFRNTP